MATKRSETKDIDVTKLIKKSKPMSRKLEELEAETGVKEVFYLEKQIIKKQAEVEEKRKIEVDRVNKECEKIEAKDKKYIDALRIEMLERYKYEQEKCQKKLNALKTKALEKIEQQLQREKEKMEAMCKNEVLKAINKYAENNGWFETAVAIYKAEPEIFEKNSDK